MEIKPPPQKETVGRKGISIVSFCGTKTISIVIVGYITYCYINLRRVITYCLNPNGLIIVYNRTISCFTICGKPTTRQDGVDEKQTDDVTTRHLINLRLSTLSYYLFSCPSISYYARCVHDRRRDTGVPRR